MPDDLESRYCHQGYNLTFSCAIRINEEQWAGAFAKKTVQRIKKKKFKIMTVSCFYVCQHRVGLPLTIKAKGMYSFTHVA